MTLNHNTDKQFHEKLLAITEQNLGNEKFGVPELAQAMNMSRATLHRKVVKFSQQSASTYIRHARLKRAKELLHQNAGTVAEIAYEVGFSNATYFVTCYREFYGYPPGKEKLQIESDDVPGDSLLPVLDEKKKYGRLFYWLAVLTIVGLLGFMVKQLTSNGEKEQKKSIAVLPFIDDSNNDSTIYLIEGLREEILNKLMVIGGIDVISRTTSDKYRNPGKSIREIGKELNANYIIEGSAQTILGNIRIRLQLIEVSSDKHLWSRPFERQITADNIFDIQEEVAIAVAHELKAQLTPYDKSHIAQKATLNPAAYNFYLQGLDYLNLYGRDNKEVNYLHAKKTFEQAVRLDTAFAEAYLRLAFIYIHYLAFTFEHENSALFNLYLDSGHTMIDKAILHDISNVSFVNQLKADYYQRKGMNDEALFYFEKLWKDKVKDYSYYQIKAGYHYWQDEFYETIKNYLFYLDMKPDSVPVDLNMLKIMAYSCTSAGFPELGKKYARMLFNQHNDSIRNMQFMASIEYASGDFHSALDKYKILNNIDPSNLEYLYRIMASYYHLRNLDSTYAWAVKYEALEVKINGKPKPDCYKGYMYQIRGMKTEAEWNIEGTIKECNEQVKNNNPFAQERWVYGLLSAMYILKGEKEKALDYFKLMTLRNTFGLLVLIQVKVWPIYDAIREEPEFKKMLKEMEYKYLSEHEKVKELLISRGIDPD